MVWILLRAKNNTTSDKKITLQIQIQYPQVTLIDRYKATKIKVSFILFLRIFILNNLKAIQYIYLRHRFVSLFHT